MKYNVGDRVKLIDSFAWWGGREATVRRILASAILFVYRLEVDGQGLDVKDHGFAEHEIEGLVEFKIGDLVEAVKGETLLRDRVFSGCSSPTLGPLASLRYLKDEGYTLRLIEAAPEPLPTKSGFYLGKVNIGHRYMFHLDRDGRWTRVGNMHVVHDPEAVDADYMRKYMPLERVVTEG